MDKIKKIIKFIGPIIVFCLILFVVLKTANAASTLGGDWNQYLDDLPGPQSNEKGEDLAISFILNGVRIVKYVIGAAAIIFGVLYGMGFVFARGREDSVTKQKQNFLWLGIGFLILLISDEVAKTVFNPQEASAERIINFDAATKELTQIANYIKWLFGSIITLLMIVSSIRLITAGGEEEMINKQKRNLTWSGIGMLVILLADNIVKSIYVIKEETKEGVKTVTVEAATSSTAITEIAGVIRLILVFIGPTAIIFTIYAGYLYITALGNDEHMNRAKRMLVGGITGIIIVYAAYAIINTIIANPDISALDNINLVE